MKLLSRLKNGNYKCRSYSRFSLLALSLLLISGCSNNEKSFALSTITEPIGEPLISFISERSGSEQIFVANLDGGNQRQISKSKGKKSSAIFYRNRRAIAYIRHNELDKTGNYDIYICNLSDGHETRLTNNQDIESDPQVTSNRDGIVYCHAVGFDTSSDISVVAKNGVSRLLVKNSISDEMDPAVNRLGDQIAFTSNNVQERPEYSQFPGGGWTETALSWPHSVFTINYDGLKLRRLTKQSIGNCFDPSYDPDGKKIIFVAQNSIRGRAIYNIYSINIDGSGLASLFNSPLQLSTPLYSPDGLHISFIVIKEKKSGSPTASALYVMQSNGGNLKRVVKEQGKNQSGAVFTPDGNRIIFTHWTDQPNSQKDICIADIDGRNFLNLTKDTGGGSQPDVR